MSATTTAVVNGVLPPPQVTVDEIAEFDKILKLRDEIFAGNHPRLTVPAHVLRTISPASNSTQLSSHSSLPVQAHHPPLPVQLPGLTLTQDGESSRAAQPQPVTTLSGINPVLLTKSDDLIKAETALQRQRLEKNLRDQFEQKRLDFRKRPAPAEAKPDFDLRAVLAKALDVVKPVSLSKEQSDKEGENDSFDENSFYSSRAPDSTPERGEQSSSEEGLAQETPAGAGPHQDPQTHDGVPSKPAVPLAKDDANPVDADDEDEEGEYSPPEADQYPAQNSSSSQAVPDPRSRQVRRYSDLDQNNKRPASPSNPNMRIVRNQITSPFAPQPSRVSPLALTKDSLLAQDRQLQNGRQRGRADSPSQSPETVQQRNKRRKLEKKAEKRSRRGIKQENVSPPPFHDIQPLGANKIPPVEERPIVIDDSPPDVRYMPAPRYIETPQRPMSRQAEFVPLSEPRIMSRTTMRPRDDQDLRRVASMHSMRMDQPREYVEYASPARQRTTSYMRVDSPMREVSDRYGAENDRPLQEIRVIRTPAPEYREVYRPEPEVRYIPEPMPPPPRERIVIDQYGRRFREIVQEPMPAPASSTARSASAYPRELPQYYDNYTPTRTGSVMVDERPRQPQPRYEHDVQPARVIRHAEQPSQGSSPTQAPKMREVYENGPPPSGRAGSVAVFDRSQQPRQIVYADNGDYRPPVRMGSVRPPPSQYDEPPILQAPRAESVRPAFMREGSAFIDDRSQIRREYVTMEQPRYRVVEPENMPPPPQMQTRYVDAQGREVVPQGQDDGAVRYVHRY